VEQRFGCENDDLRRSFFFDRTPREGRHPHEKRKGNDDRWEI